jgi:hypothetical protein
MARRTVGITSIAIMARTNMVAARVLFPPNLSATLAMSGSTATARIMPHMTGVIKGFTNWKA